MLKLKNIKILLIFVVCVLCNNAISMDYSHQEGPPLFQLITEDGRKIYILGTTHTTPLNLLLSSVTIHELEEIAGRQALLFTEHETTNRVALEYLQYPQNTTTEIRSLLGQSPYKMLQIVENDFNKIKDSKVYLGVGHESGTHFTQTLEAKPWLFAVILGTHANILCHQKYIGLERELQYGENWKEKWGGIHYLETPEQAINFLRDNNRETVDHTENLDWIKRSMATIMHFHTISTLRKEDMLEAMVIEEMEESARKEQESLIKQYSWNVINIGNRQEIPKSAIDRNSLWADVILKEVKERPDTKPILIVVGMGHLAGFHGKFSLLYLLMHKPGLKVVHVKRLTNSGAWVPVG